LRTRWIIRCLALALVGAHAHADGALRHFDIQAQAAASALNEFARQADVTLVFSSELVERHQTPAVRGDFTVIDGLKRLLDGTGLSFNQVSASTIAINVGHAANSRAPPTSDAASDPAGNDNQTKGESNVNHRGLFTRIAGLFAMSGALLAGGRAGAQDTATPGAAAPVAATDASAANTNTLDEVVVTATAQSTRKLDASFQVTTASLEEIHNVDPSSSADLLKIVPSVWAESGGGQAGPNI